MLVGTDEYQKMMEARSHSDQKKRKITLAGTNEFRKLLQEREKLRESKNRNAIVREKPSTADFSSDISQEESPKEIPTKQDVTEHIPNVHSEIPQLRRSFSPEIIAIDDFDVATPSPDPTEELNEQESTKDDVDENMDADKQIENHNSETDTHFYRGSDIENLNEADNGEAYHQDEDHNEADHGKANNDETDNGKADHQDEEHQDEEHQDENHQDKNDQNENHQDENHQLQKEKSEKKPKTTPIYLADDVNLMRRTILSQLTGQSFPQIENSLLVGPYREVYDILEHTVRDFEGHSTLLIGPRGSGKSLILNKAIDSLKRKYNDLFMTIRLNASLHSDDKIALREIARQLDLNSNKFGTTSGETTTFEQRAISDTFSNILLTLDSNAPGREYDEEKEHPTPVIVIIDEIEKFTSNVKQTLLYNIFDLSQSSKIPIAVIGVSTMITTRELLEKRVRSRFSQRIIDITRAETMQQFWENAKLNLIVAPKCVASFHNKEYPKQWNTYIEQLNQRPSCLKKIIYKIYYTTKNYKDVNTCGLLPVSRISCTQPFPLDEGFETYMKNMSPNSVQAAVAAVSNLELLLVIAAARWIERLEVPHVNFSLAYKEYTDMMKAFNREATTLSSSVSYIDNTVLAGIKVSHKIWSPKVLRDCWANLYKMGLLFDVITTNNEVNGNNNYNMYKETVIEDSKMLQLDVSLDDLGSLIDGSAPFKKLTRL